MRYRIRVIVEDMDSRTSRTATREINMKGTESDIPEAGNLGVSVNERTSLLRHVLAEMIAEVL